MAHAHTFLSFHPSQASQLEYHGGGQPEEILSKAYPLRHTWVVWEQLAQTSGRGEYSDATHEVVPFDTVQGFWRLWNHLPQPSELLESKKLVRKMNDTQHGIDALMIFKQGIRPAWEDPANAEGGHFQFLLKTSVPGPQIDEYWNNLVLGVVGGTIEPAGKITGVRLVDKMGQRNPAMGIRIEVWFTDYEESMSALKKSVEKCMATRLDGSMGTIPKGETKSHKASH